MHSLSLWINLQQGSAKGMLSFLSDMNMFTSLKKEKKVWYEQNERKHKVTIFISHSFSFVQTFAYDYCFWSMDESETEKFAGQFLEILLEAARLFMSWFSTKYFICIVLFWFVSSYPGAGGASKDKVLFTHQVCVYCVSP